MTGLALYQTQPWRDNWPETVPRFDAIELPFASACSTIESVCANWTNRLAFGWERFDIDDQTHKKTRGGIYDALHVIGVCRYLAAKYGCRVLPEGQRHTPTAEDREQLQRLGWWVPGKDDAQSAACHMMNWLIRTNELTPAQREVIYSRNQP